jgi:histidine triad (HIT) family protein
LQDCEWEVPSEKIWEDENFIAIFNINPVGEGHSLVIPKKHFVDLESLDKNVSCNYIEAINKTGNLLMKKFSSKGFNVVLNNGEAAGQSVFHVHFHVLPRKKEDGKRVVFLGESPKDF